MLSEQTVNAILNYLATQPYAQVAPIINRISQEVQQNKQEEKKEEEGGD